MRFVVALPVAAAIAALAVRAGGQEEPAVYVTHRESPVAAGSLVIRFDSNVPDGQRAALLEAAGISEWREIGVERFVVAVVREAEKDAVGAALAETTAVSAVSDDPVRMPAGGPNDPWYPDQWHLTRIGLDDVWETADGTGVKVAVVDTGVAYEDHTEPVRLRTFAAAPDFAATDFLDPHDSYDMDDHANDDYGHGTHVAGTIAESTNNGIGGAGIAPGARIIPVKVCGPNPNPVQAYGCPTSRIADGIGWAVEHGAEVINLSIGGGPGTLTEAERAALDAAEAADVVVVAASGNKGNPELDVPAAAESVLAVGAIGRNSIRANYSNYGIGENGKILELVAPGGDPQEVPESEVLQQSYGNCLQSVQDFTTFVQTPCQGTSMATAHVSGVAALIRGEFPQLDRADVREVLMCSAEDLGPPGLDAQYGHGLVDAVAALQDADVDNIPDCIDETIATPTPTPEPPENDCLPPTSTPTEPVTDTPTPTLTATPTLVPTPTESPRPTDSPSPTPSGTPTPTPSPTPTGPTDSPLPTDSASATPSDSPSPTESPRPTDSPSPTPTLSPSPSPTPSPVPIKCGDVNCSGDVDGADSLGVLKWVTGVVPAEPCIGKGYVNCDPFLDVADAITILRYSGKLPLHLPAGCSGIG